MYSQFTDHPITQSTKLLLPSLPLPYPYACHHRPSRALAHCPPLVACLPVACCLKMSSYPIRTLSGVWPIFTGRNRWEPLTDCWLHYEKTEVSQIGQSECVSECVSEYIIAQRPLQNPRSCLPLLASSPLPRPGLRRVSVIAPSSHWRSTGQLSNVFEILLHKQKSWPWS